MTVWLINNTDVGYFCCNFEYDATTYTCGNPTLGSHQPFELQPGQVIWNRANGDANFRNIGAATATVTLSANIQSTTVSPTTVEDQNGTSTPVSRAQQTGNGNTIAIAIGIAVPLGILLLLAVIALFLLWRRMQAIEARASLSSQPAAKTTNIGESGRKLDLPSAMSVSPTQRYEADDALAVSEALPDGQMHELRTGRDPIEMAGTEVLL